MLLHRTTMVPQGERNWISRFCSLPE